MSNKTGAFGLRPVRKLDGSPYNGAVQKCYVSPNYAVALYVGDIVDYDTTLANKDATWRYPTVILANAGTYQDDVISLGVIVAIEPNPSYPEYKHIPASTGGYVYVCTDPEMVYHVRDDGAGTPSAVFVGQNCNFTYAVGTSAKGLGGTTLDTSTPAANASFMGTIIGLADLPDNEAGDYAIWEVTLTHGRWQRIGAAGDTGVLGVTST